MRGLIIQDMSRSATADEAVIYPHASIGYRVWELYDHQLYPLMQDRDHPWHPGENKSHCVYASHHAPGSRCHCGFNVWHSLKDAINYPEGSECRIVIGIVAGAGAARVHHLGTRFEKAQILAIAPCVETIRDSWPQFGALWQYIAEVQETAERYSTIYCSDYLQLQAQATSWEEQGLVKAVPSSVIPAVSEHSDPVASMERHLAVAFTMIGFLFLLGPAIFLWHVFTALLS